jgi:hypothetical protein
VDGVTFNTSAGTRNIRLTFGGHPIGPAADQPPAWTVWGGAVVDDSGRRLWDITNEVRVDLSNSCGMD